MKVPPCESRIFAFPWGARVIGVVVSTLLGVRGSPSKYTESIVKAPPPASLIEMLTQGAVTVVFPPQPVPVRIVNEYAVNSICSEVWVPPPCVRPLLSPLTKT